MQILSILILRRLQIRQISVLLLHSHQLLRHVRLEHLAEFIEREVPVVVLVNQPHHFGLVVLRHIHFDGLEALAKVIVGDVSVIISVKLSEDLEQFDLAVKDLVSHGIYQALDMGIVDIFQINLSRLNVSLELLRRSIGSHSAR